MFQEDLHTEVGQCRSEKYRRKFSLADQLLVKFCTCSVQKLDLFEKLGFLVTCHDLIQLRRIQRDLSCLAFFGTFFGIGKHRNFLASTLINTFEILSGADRPVDRAGRNAKLLFDVIEQIKGIVGITVHFIDKGKNRNMAHHTNFKKLSGLCFYTFGSVNDHNRRIRCHQRTIRILREVLMSRCIQNIDTEAIIVKLQHGGSYRNTSFFFNLHPVRNCMACRCFSLYGTCQIDRTSIQQKFLCQRRFSGIRMRNDRKSSSSFNFTCYISHCTSSMFLFSWSVLSCKTAYYL